MFYRTPAWSPSTHSYSSNKIKKSALSDMRLGGIIQEASKNRLLNCAPFSPFKNSPPRPHLVSKKRIIYIVNLLQTPRIFASKAFRTGKNTFISFN